MAHYDRSIAGVNETSAHAGSPFPGGAGSPQVIGAAVVVEMARHHEEVIGEPVGVFESGRIDGLIEGERGDQAFGPADHRTRQVKPRRNIAPSWQDEGCQGFEPGVHGIDFILETHHLGGSDPQRTGAAAAFLGHGQVGPEIEEIVLDARQHRVTVAVCMHPGEADHRVRLIHGAEGLDPEGVLGHPAAVAQGRLAPVSAAGIDPVQPDDGSTLPA